MSANNTLKQAPSYWEKKGLKALALWPLSKLFGVVSSLRRFLYDLSIIKSSTLPVPVVIVGNIRVGGTGKTPTVLAIAKVLKARGFHPGIISRGYKGSNQEAIEVITSSLPSIVGDEPCYMASQLQDLNIPIFIHPQRVIAGQELLKRYPDINVIISDDGLQHRGLVRWPAREGGRDIEFVVRDSRGEGNHFLLPAGPLREPASRERDATLFTGSLKNQRSGISDEYFLGRRSFHLAGHLGKPYQLVNSANTLSFEQITEQFLPNNIIAIAGLGNPQRFFNDLAKQGIAGKCIPLPDHATYTPEFFNHIKAQCILITEKDAVKIWPEHPEVWAVQLQVQLPQALLGEIHQALQTGLSSPHGHQTA